MTADPRVPAFLGRVLDSGGEPVGTCFQVAPGVVVTAWHVLVDAGAEEVGATVAVDGLPLGGASAEPATVERVDPVHDLAVLTRAVPLPASEGRLTATDEQVIGTDVVVTGHSVVAEASGTRTRYLDAPGAWAGGTTRGDAVPLGRLSSQDLQRGMSGAPVRRRSDGAVVGVVSARYNSADGWLRDAVWVARTENLRPLLVGVAGAETAVLAGRAPLTAPADLVLAVDGSQVRLRGAGVDVTGAHGGVRPGLAGAVDDVRRARARAGVHRAEPAAAEPDPAGVAASLRRAGALLAESFLPAPLAEALGEVMRRAEASSMPLRLGVEVTGDLSRLPWEALPDPLSGTPLALHRLVSVYRRAPAAALARLLAGPLRIVVAIAAPSTGGGPVLDYERELRSVLAAVKGARAGDAQVRIVPFATTAAIRQALAGGDVHVLHVSGHGGPGSLHLETETGAAATVSARRFLEEAVPPGCMPPVVALAACYTDAPAGEQAPSFAAELVAAGAPAVIGTETSVTDRYATRVFARVYEELAQSGEPDVVAAVGHARRVVQGELDASPDPRDRAVAGLDEWGVVTVLAGQAPSHLLDPAQPPTRSAPVDGSRRTVAGLTARDPGEFVGRRSEQRTLPAVLTGRPVDGVTHHGVLLHGIGGVGKTTLAAEVIRRVHDRDPARREATVTGATTVDGVFDAVADALRGPLLMAGADGSDGLQALTVVTRLDLPWQQRWPVLRDYVLDAIPLLLVLDNFEDNLTTATGQLRPVRDDALAGLLAAWAREPGRSRLLVTSRYPLRLPEDAHTALLARHLGPLTEAETLKLVWSLPRLDALEDADVTKVWRVVGGHPRALEYVDALLAQGQGRFPDITARLNRQVQQMLQKLGIGARGWLTSERTLDAALADAVTVAADDVLLPDLLAGLADVPDAEPALLGLSVYRQPVDVNALLFQVGHVDETAAWVPDRQAAEQRILAALADHGLEPADLNTALAAGDLSPLPGALVEVILPALRELSSRPTPPRRTDVDLDAVIGALAGSSLLTLDPDTATLFVHRWTAGELARGWSEDGRRAELREAHRNAAAYWRWRVQVWPQDERADVADLLEARHHLLQAGEPDAAITLTEGICLQLHQWGAWDEETALVHETLRLLPAGDNRRAVWLHHLGMLAQRRGDYPEAERRYRASLEIDERLGDQAGASKAYHQLGMLAQARGDHAEAERRYRAALEIMKRLGDQSGVSKAYHQLGILAQERGDYPEAERGYVASLEIDERLGDQSGVSISYHQLGMLAQARGDYPEAERRYRAALEIKERLGDQPGAAVSWSQLGVLLTEKNQLPDAVTCHLHALAYRSTLNLPATSFDARALVDLRARMGDAAFAAAARSVIDESSLEQLTALLNGQG